MIFCEEVGSWRLSRKSLYCNDKDEKRGFYIWIVELDIVEIKSIEEYD